MRSRLKSLFEDLSTDGALHEYEQRLMRRIGPILDIEDAADETIHRTVRSRLGLPPETP